MLLTDIKEKTIPDDEHYKEVFKRRPEFAYPNNNPAKALRLFEGRLQAAHKKVAQKSSRAAEEEAIFRADRLVVPPSPTDFYGRPRWNGSNVQALLKKDFADDNHVGLTTKQFQSTRPEYGTLTVRELGRRMAQEDRLRKFNNQYGDRHNYY